MSKPQRCLSDVKNGLGQSLPRDPDDPTAVICAQESLYDKDGNPFAKDDQLIRCAVDQYGIPYPTDGDGNQVIPAANETIITQNADGALVITIVDPNGNVVMGPIAETDAQVSGNSVDGWTIVDDSGDEIFIPAPAGDFTWDIVQDGDGNVTFTQLFNGSPTGVAFTHEEDDTAVQQNASGSWTITDDSGNQISIPAPNVYQVNDGAFGNSRDLTPSDILISEENISEMPGDFTAECMDEVFKAADGKLYVCNDQFVSDRVIGGSAGTFLAGDLSTDIAAPTILTPEVPLSLVNNTDKIIRVVWRLEVSHMEIVLQDEDRLYINLEISVDGGAFSDVTHAIYHMRNNPSGTELVLDHQALNRTLRSNVQAKSTRTFAIRLGAALQIAGGGLSEISGPNITLSAWGGTI